MNQKLRIILFGTLLLSAFLLTGSLSSQAFAATTTTSASLGTPSLAQPGPDMWNYNRGYRAGYSQGYRDGLAACSQHHYGLKKAPYSAYHLTAFTRGYTDGYAEGYTKGLRSCNNYDYDQHHHNYGNDHQYSDGGQH